MTKAERRVIRGLYDDCLRAVEDYKLSEEGADLINQGWLEALECVLRLEVQYRIKKKTKSTDKKK